jgi:hypothetical protein
LHLIQPEGVNLPMTTRRSLVFCVAIFWHVNSVQGAVVINPSSIAGVALIGANDPSFNDAVTQVLGPSLTPTTNDWLPFSAVLTNNTSQPIVAVIVKWVKLLPDGRKGTLIVHREFFSSSRPTVQAGKSAVALPGWVFLRPLPSGSQDATNQPDHFTQLQTFQAAASVEVTLDGVLLASGQFLGPDDTQVFEVLQSLQFGRSVYSEALTRNTSGQFVADVVNWLEGIASQGQHLDIDPRTGVPANSKVSGMATAASVLLGAYKAQGSSLMYQFAQARSSDSMPTNIFR